LVKNVHLRREGSFLDLSTIRELHPSPVACGASHPRCSGNRCAIGRVAARFRVHLSTASARVFPRLPCIWAFFTNLKPNCSTKVLRGVTLFFYSWDVNIANVEVVDKSRAAMGF
jgi:hypothetical protein